MEPKNNGSHKESPLERGSFSGSRLVFGGVEYYQISETPSQSQWSAGFPQTSNVRTSAAPHAKALDDTPAPSACIAQLTGPVGNRDLESTIMLNTF